MGIKLLTVVHRGGLMREEEKKSSSLRAEGGISTTYIFSGLCLWMNFIFSVLLSFYVVILLYLYF